MRFLRKTTGNTRRDRIRNQNIREELKVELLIETIEKTTLRWYGHVVRMKEERLPRKMLEVRSLGTRGNGRNMQRDCVPQEGRQRNTSSDLLWKEKSSENGRRKPDAERHKEYVKEEEEEQLGTSFQLMRVDEWMHNYYLTMIRLHLKRFIFLFQKGPSNIMEM